MSFRALSRYFLHLARQRTPHLCHFLFSIRLLCKLSVRSLSLTASVGEALAALKGCPESDLCVVVEKKAVIRKIGVADVISYPCSSDNNLFDPAGALCKSVSDILFLKETTIVDGALVCRIEASARMVIIYVLDHFNFSEM